MNGSCKMPFASVCVALFFFGINTAQGLLYISGVHLFTDDGATNCTAETGRLTFVVDVRNNNNPSPTYQPELEFVGTQSPTLNFYLQGVPRTAYFDGLGSPLDGKENLMFFVYTPKPTDYGTGLTLPNGTFSNQRKAVIFDSTTLTIRDALAPTATLPANGQYPEVGAASAFNALAYNAAFEINMYKLESPQTALGVTVNPGVTTQILVKRAPGSELNTVPLNLVVQSANNTIASISPTSATMPAGQSSFLFTITGVGPGTTSMTIYSQDHVPEQVTIPVAVSLSPTQSQVSLTPSRLEVAENAYGAAMVRVSLGSPSASAVTLNISGYIAGKLEGSPTVTIPANQTEGYFTLYPRDGDANPILTLTDPNAVYQTATLNTSVSNVPPRIVSPVDGSRFTTMIGLTMTLSATAIDPAGVNDPLTFSWNFGDGTTSTGGTASKSHSAAGQYTITLTVTDGDGGASTRTLDFIVEPPVIDFTDITPDSITFRMPSAAKTFNYAIRTAPRMTDLQQEWSDWLPLAGSNIVAGGNFNAAASITPPYDVPVNVMDDMTGFTLITVDISGIYKANTSLYFRVVLPEPHPTE